METADVTTGVARGTLELSGSRDDIGSEAVAAALAEISDYVGGAES